MVHKIVLVGDTGVGKSSLLNRLIHDTFNPDQMPTIGAAYHRMFAHHPDSGRTMDVEIWDTAGQERYKSLLPMYTRNAAVVWVVLASGSDTVGYDRWCESLTHLPTILVWSKSDLRPRPADADGLYTSAKTGHGLQRLMHNTLRMMGSATEQVPSPETAPRTPPDGCCAGWRS